MPLNENMTTLTRKDFSLMLSQNPKLWLRPIDSQWEESELLAKCAVIAEKVIRVYSDMLSNGHSIVLANIGHFVVLNKKSRIGRNPKTKEECIIPAMKVVSLRKRGPAGPKLSRMNILIRIKDALSDYPMVNAAEVNNTFLDFIKRAGTGDERIELRGFGVFSPSLREAGTCRNPKTGATIFKEARYSLRFQLSTVIHNKLNKKKS